MQYKVGFDALLVVDQTACKKLQKRWQDHFHALSHQTLCGIVIGEGVVLDINLTYDSRFWIIFVIHFDGVKIAIARTIALSKDFLPALWRR